MLRLRSARELGGDIVQPTAKCRRLPVPAAASKGDVILSALDKAKGRNKPFCGNIIRDKGPRSYAHAEATDSRLAERLERLGRFGRAERRREPQQFEHLGNFMGRIVAQQVADRFAVAVAQGAVGSQHGFDQAGKGGPQRVLVAEGARVVVFAFDGFEQADLDMFADTMDLPRFTPEVVGGPLGEARSEASMDLQVVHAIAPDARLVVVNAMPTVEGGGGTFEKVGRMFDDAAAKYPASVWTLSIGWGCDKLVTAADLLRSVPEPTREEVREAISANYCRCTGYHAIVDAVMAAAHGTEQKP